MYSLMRVDNYVFCITKLETEKENDFVIAAGNLNNCVRI